MDLQSWYDRLNQITSLGSNQTQWVTNRAQQLRQQQRDKEEQKWREQQAANQASLQQKLLAAQQETARQQKAYQQQLQSLQEKFNQAYSPVTTQSYGAVTPNQVGRGNQGFENFVNAIAKQESGGRYNAMGTPVNGDRAYGKYQIMGRNFLGKGGWDYQALGRDVSLSEYMNNPQIQETIARKKLQGYYNKYGAANAAAAWYGGPGAVKSNYRNKTQYASGQRMPTINGYAAAVMRRMGY